MDSFEQSGFGRMDTASFGMWLNLDKVLAHADYKRLGPLVWSSFLSSIGDEHKSYIHQLTNSADIELAVSAFTLFVHEGRHSHDLLFSPYGSVLARQHTRAALHYLFLRHDLIFQHKSIIVPLSQWLKFGKMVRLDRPELDLPSPHIIHIEASFRNIKDKLKVYNDGRLNKNRANDQKYPDAVSILEASAILMQEVAIFDNFGEPSVDLFRRSFHDNDTIKPKNSAKHKYYGALDFIVQNFEGDYPTEMVSYLLLASLCGNFQDPNTQRLQYPSDILVELIVWLHRNHLELAHLNSFDELVFVVDKYFEETHGGDVADMADMIRASNKANQLSGDVLRQELYNYEKEIGSEYPEARLLLDGYDNFCEVHDQFSAQVLANPLWYCSHQYLEIQPSLPTPVIFIESELGVPVDRQLEEDFYIQFEERLYLADIPEEMQGRFKPFAFDDQVIRIAHILSPHSTKTRESTYAASKVQWRGKPSVALDNRLWQYNHDSIGSIQFFTDGPNSGVSKHVQRDLMSFFKLCGTKVYTADNKPIEAGMLDINMFEESFRQDMKKLRVHKWGVDPEEF